MDADIVSAVRAIHDSPVRAVLYTTGGAAHFPAWLLSEPGASDTVLESCIPYARRSFLELLPASEAAGITSFASISTARALAAAAYRRAASLAPAGIAVVGVAATCALASGTSRVGRVHRACVATHSSESTAAYELTMCAGARSRLAEDRLAARLALQALLDACNSRALAVSRASDLQLVRTQISAGDRLSAPLVHEAPDALQGLLKGECRFVEVMNGCAPRREATGAEVLLPGSFNPMHEGHRKLLEVACNLQGGKRGAFEMSVRNPDKGTLTEEDVRRRIAQFKHGERALLLTDAPLFTQKATLFPGAVFVVGADTAVRLVMPKYYGGEAEMMEALVYMRSQGCKILVAARQEQGRGAIEHGASRKLQTLSDVAVPAGLKSLFEEIPVSAFRADISSSALRRAGEVVP